MDGQNYYPNQIKQVDVFQSVYIVPNGKSAKADICIVNNTSSNITISVRIKSAGARDTEMEILLPDYQLIPANKPAIINNIRIKERSEILVKSSSLDTPVHVWAKEEKE